MSQLSPRQAAKKSSNLGHNCLFFLPMVETAAPFVDVIGGDSWTPSDTPDLNDVAHTSVGQDAAVQAFGNGGNFTIPDGSTVVYVSGRQVKSLSNGLMHALLGDSATNRIGTTSDGAIAFEYNDTLTEHSVGAADPGEDYFCLIAVDLSAGTFTSYHSIAGAASVQVDQDTGLSLGAWTLPRSIRFGGAGFDQASYGMALMAFDSNPGGFTDALDWIVANWTSGRKVLPPEWKNLAYSG